ncbi:MAG: hypothetical protein KDD04_08645, partial [Sinomicrobium sp.]|nr:hypothetical protein [Sinomicrobium sp.]
TVKSGRNGLLVPVRDSKALAEAMLKMYHSKDEELEKMGYYSRERVLSVFDDKRISEQFFMLINQILRVSPEVEHEVIGPRI